MMLIDAMHNGVFCAVCKLGVEFLPVMLGFCDSARCRLFENSICVRRVNLECNHSWESDGWGSN